MNTADRVLALKLVTDVGDISKQMKSVEKGTKKAGARFKDMGSAAKSWGKALGGAFVLSGLAALPGIIGDLNAGFKEGEQASRNLGITWKNLGLDAGDLAGTIDDISGKALDLGFDDAEVVSAFDTFLSLTGDTAKSNEALAAAMDLARAKGWPLSKAVKYVSKHLDDMGGSLDANTGKAEDWAKHHPIEVHAGKIVDALENVIGALGTGDWDAVMKNLGTVGGELESMLFGDPQTVDLGSAGVVTIRTGGLIQRFQDVGGKLVTAIVDGLAGLGPKVQTFWDEEIATVDWGKAIGDALANVWSAITSDPDKTGDVALAGGAIAGVLVGALFLESLFSDALGAVMKAPKFLLGKGVEAAGNAIGLIFRGAMFAADMLGRGLMSAARMIRDSEEVQKAAHGLGSSLGGRITKGIIAGILFIDIINAIADGLNLPDAGEPGNRTRLRRNPITGKFERYADGTSSAARGWAIVGEKGPELVRMSGGEHVYPAGSWGMGGTTVNVTIQTGVGDPVAIGREVDRVLRIYRKRAGILSAGQMI